MLGYPESSLFFGRAKIPACARFTPGNSHTMNDWAASQPMPPVSRAALLRLTIATEGGLLAAALALGWLVGAPFWAEASAGPLALVHGVAAGLALFALAMGLLELPTRFAATVQRDVDRLKGAFQEATFVDLALISVLAGAGEEAFFRGFLQTAAAGYVGLPVAILAVSVAFGAAHLISPAYATFTAILSVLFGVLYVWSGNIVVPMIAHAAYDLVALLYAMRYRKKGHGAHADGHP